MTRVERTTSSTPRVARQLLVDPVFGPFFYAKQVSAAAMWAYNVVAAIVIYDLTGSTFAVGLVTVAQWAPQLVFAPLSGAMADRGDRRRQLLLGWSIMAATSGALALWIQVVGLDHASVAPAVIGASLAAGLGLVIGVPAMQALLPELVRPGELAPAVALSSVPMAMGRAVGPAVGAIVLALGGPVLAFGVTAVGNAAFVVVVLMIPISRTRVPATGDLSIRAGFRHVLLDPVIPRLLAATAAVALGGEPAITLTPAMAAGFGASTSAAGVFVSAYGIGAGASLLVLGRVGRLWGLAMMGSVGLATVTASNVAMAMAPGVVAAAALFASSGAGAMFALTSATTQLQERLPDEVRGRVMALWGVAMVGSRPLAASLVGLVADLRSVDAALITVGVLVAGVAAWARPSRVRRSAPDELPLAS